MPADDARKVGVWRAVGSFQLRDVIWPEGALALVGAGVALVLTMASTVADRVDLMGDLNTLASGLLAVVFAALAIVVSLPSRTYLGALDASRGGIKVFLDPFLVTAGALVVLDLLVLSYKLAAPDVPEEVEGAWFAAIGFLVVFALVDVLALARQLVRHGILRAADATADRRADE